MNDELRVKFAEAEGIICPKPTYNNDNDIERFVWGMSITEGMRYVRHLANIIISGSDHSKGINLWELEMHQASVEQKQEAIIKAMGWEDLK